MMKKRARTAIEALLPAALAALALALASAHSARAEAADSGDAWSAGHEVDMVQITSSYPSGYHGKLAAALDDANAGAVTAFHFTDSRGTDQVYKIEDVRQGVVLVKALGKEILKINSPDFSKDTGGVLTLTFLKGFFGSDMREVQFEFLRFSGAAEWQLETDDSQGREPFDGLAVKVGTTLGIPTGVDEIDLSRSGRTVRQYDPDQLPASSFPLDLSLAW